MEATTSSWKRRCRHESDDVVMEVMTSTGHMHAHARKCTHMHAHARTYTHTHIQNVEDTVRSLGHAAKHQVAFKLDPSFSDLDLPFAINLFYSMFTIAYTPRFPYQFKMTLIEYSRILKHNECSRPGRLGARHDSMLTSRSRRELPRPAETCREVPNTLCFPRILECLT